MSTKSGERIEFPDILGCSREDRKPKEWEDPDRKTMFVQKFWITKDGFCNKCGAYHYKLYFGKVRWNGQAIHQDDLGYQLPFGGYNEGKNPMLAGSILDSPQAKITNPDYYQPGNSSEWVDHKDKPIKSRFRTKYDRWGNIQSNGKTNLEKKAREVFQMYTKVRAEADSHSIGMFTWLTLEKTIADFERVGKLQWLDTLKAIAKIDGKGFKPMNVNEFIVQFRNNYHLLKV